MVVSVPTAVVGYWFLYYLLVSIPIKIIRAIAVCLPIFIITLLNVTVYTLRKRRERSS